MDVCRQSSGGLHTLWLGFGAFSLLLPFFAHTSSRTGWWKGCSNVM